MIILYPNRNNPIVVDIGELIGCWIAWASVFKPHLNWRTCCIPKFHGAQNLDVHLNNEPRKIYGVDIILRSIAFAHNNNGVIYNVMQATGEFVVENNNYFIPVERQGLFAENIGGISLSQYALETWDAYSRVDRLTFYKFGTHRLDWVLEKTGINIDDLEFPQNFYE